MIKKVHIRNNQGEKSLEAEKNLRKILDKLDVEITNSFDDTVELVIAIGGDGTFLNAVNSLDYPDCCFAGINTGHLGFFQEINTEHIEIFEKIIQGNGISIQEITPLKIKIYAGGVAEPATHYAVNEISIRHKRFKVIHLHTYISNQYIEKFSGDGIIISTTTGSTAYNYSAGGCLIDSSLRLLQLTPISALNTNAYRCITGGFILPPDQEISIIPETGNEEDAVLLPDGRIMDFDIINKAVIGYSKDKKIKIIRLNSYNFWDKVKEKFL